MLGRPPTDHTEREFKEYVKNHLARNMLECMTINQLYLIFTTDRGEPKPISNDKIEKLFEDHKQQPLYQKL